MCVCLYMSVSVCLGLPQRCVFSHFCSAYLFCFPFFLFFSSSVFFSVYLHSQTVNKMTVALQATQLVRTHMPVPMPDHMTDAASMSPS